MGIDGEPSKPAGRAAFFDLDRTLIPGSSLFLLARAMYDRDLFRIRDLMAIGWKQVKFVLRGESDVGVAEAQSTALQFVKGRSHAELVRLGDEIAAERIIPEVYPDIARIIERHQTAGDQTWLVTAAPTELAEPIAAALGMTGAIGTEAEVDTTGVYTGRLSGTLLHGPRKAEAVRELAARTGIDLGGSHAYSDSMNDQSLLEAVGHPHAVNPDDDLFGHAMRHGWAVHELRPARRRALVRIGPVGGTLVALAVGGTVGYLVGRRRGRRAVT